MSRIARERISIAELPLHAQTFVKQLDRRLFPSLTAIAAALFRGGLMLQTPGIVVVSSAGEEVSRQRRPRAKMRAPASKGQGELVLRERVLRA